MTSRNSTVFAVLVALLLPASVAVAQDGEGTADQPVRLGYVDIQLAIRSVEDGRQAMQRLEQELSQRQAELDQREEQLRQLTEQLDQDLTMLDGDARRERLNEYQQQVEEYQQMYLSQQQELYTMEQDATQEIVTRMLQIVADIAQERGLTMVFEKTRSALVWATQGTDLTDELIRRYEEAH